MITEREIIERVYGMQCVDAMPEFGETLETQLSNLESRIDQSNTLLATSIAILAERRQSIRRSIRQIREAAGARGLPTLTSNVQLAKQARDGIVIWRNYLTDKRSIIETRDSILDHQVRAAKVKQKIAMRGNAGEASGDRVEDISAEFSKINNMQVDYVLKRHDTRVNQYLILFRTGEHFIVGSGDCQRHRRPSYRVGVLLSRGTRGGANWETNIIFSVLDPYNMHVDAPQAAEYDYQNYIKHTDDVGWYYSDNFGPLMSPGYSCSVDGEGDEFNAGQGELQDHSCVEVRNYYGLPGGAHSVGVEYSGLPHPHILHGGRGGTGTHSACMGTYSTDTTKYFQSRSWLNLAIIMHDFVCSFNPDDDAGKHGFEMYEHLIYDESEEPTVATIVEPAQQPAQQPAQPVAPALPRWEPTFFIAGRSAGECRIQWLNQPQQGHHIELLRIYTGSAVAAQEWRDFPALDINGVAGVSDALCDGSLTTVEVTTAHDNLTFMVTT